MAARVNRRFILRERPQGQYDPKVLERVTEPVPTPGPNQALVRLKYLSLDPTYRIWMGEGASYMPPVPLNSVMRGIGVGEVVASNTSKYRVGTKVFGMLGWQDYALISPTDEVPVTPIPGFVPVPIPTMMGALGATGMTAYFCMKDIARPRRGETMVVSAAAGAVGSIAGQIGKIHGLRVVGIAGTREKCDWLVKDLGFDAAICRRDPDWRAQLKAACPNGVDIDFENVGGEIMDAVLELMNIHGRVVLCGLISEYGADGRAMGNLRYALVKRLTVQGFIVLDHVKRFPLAAAQMGYWLWRGKIKDRNTIVKGFDQAPQALTQLYTGENIGKLLVEIDE